MQLQGAVLRFVCDQCAQVKHITIYVDGTYVWDTQDHRVSCVHETLDSLQKRSHKRLLEIHEVFGGEHAKTWRLSEVQDQRSGDS